MKPKVYIDGQESVAGLTLYQRLAERRDVELLLISGGKRDDLWERKRMFDSSDVVFLCLPEEEAREVVDLAEKPTVRLIDCSGAHADAPGWDYGLAELSDGQREKLQSSRRVVMPGSYAVGFISIVRPLVKKGILPKDYPLTCFALTGYSAGGKKMISEYESGEKAQPLRSPRICAIDLKHRQLAEMKSVCGLSRAPVFCPIVDDHKSGMAVTVMLHNDLLGGMTGEMIHEALSAHYQGARLIKVMPYGWKISTLSAGSMAGKDTMTLVVSGSEAQTMITALYDNLGRGAAGAAIQNMNIMLGLDETAGLVVK